MRSQSSQIPRDRKYSGGCQGLQGRQWEVRGQWAQSFCEEDEKVLWMDGGGVYTDMHVLNATDLDTYTWLKW